MLNTGHTIYIHFMLFWQKSLRAYRETADPVPWPPLLGPVSPGKASPGSQQLVLNRIRFTLSLDWGGIVKQRRLCASSTMVSAGACHELFQMADSWLQALLLLMWTWADCWSDWVQKGTLVLIRVLTGSLWCVWSSQLATQDIALCFSLDFLDSVFI